MISPAESVRPQVAWVSLGVGVTQGFALYILHEAAPAEAVWAVPLWFLAWTLPPALLLLSEHFSSRRVWPIIGAIALLLAALAAYSAWAQAGLDGRGFLAAVAIYAPPVLVWFIALPFVQARLRRGRWTLEYGELFRASWQNPLLLFEAAGFTLVFWIILVLWAELFSAIGIRFFAETFRQPVFRLIATPLAFSYAMYLVQTREAFADNVRRHALGVFAWLLPLVAAVSVMFVAALPFTGLQPLWNTGHATFLMLLLIVLFIHFLNAGYQDGERTAPYPQWLRLVLRVAVFALPVLAALAAYSLGLRVAQYGWTLQRVWAGAATLVAGLYALGYAWAALSGTPWMRGLARVNVGMAFVVMGVLVLFAGPPLDARRITAASQLSRLADGTVSPERFDYAYLRKLGRFGQAALDGLAAGPQPAASLADAARAARPGKRPEPLPDASTLRGRILLAPQGAVLDQAFIAYVEQASKDRPGEQPLCLRRTEGPPCVLLSIDLDRDGQPELATVGSFPQTVYSRVNGKWTAVGRLMGPAVPRAELDRLLSGTRIQAEAPAYQNVRIGDRHFIVQPLR